jgi:site-specific DNA-methyltransferase (adenine-specific)
VTPYYADDAVTIYHADYRDVADVLQFDVIVTDPPYGIGWDVGTGGWRGRARDRDGTSFNPIHGDDGPFDPSWLLAYRKPTVLFGANHYADRLPPSPSWIVWDKRDGAKFGPDQSDCELAWTNLGGPARIFRLVWNTLSRIKDEKTAGGSHQANHHRKHHVLHPAQKPIVLMRWIIDRCPPGIILDPFMGSGSTLVAAKERGRKAIGIEIEERYCEIAARRCSQEVLGLEVSA